MKITIIAAIGNNNEIGYKNQLLWHLPADLKRFKSLTIGHHIIMGRNTYESIGKPLPNRTSIVITRNKNYQAEGCIIAHSLQEAIKAVKNDDNLFIIGGADIYKQAIFLANELDICKVDGDFLADAYFPSIDLNIWNEVCKEVHTANDKNVFDYSFITYQKK